VAAKAGIAAKQKTPMRKAIRRFFMSFPKKKPP
jgi:hypothetical protein